MIEFLNKVIDLWVRNFGDNSNNKINLAYRSITSVATVYNLKETLDNAESIKDLEDVITDEDKLEIILLLKLV